MRHAWSAVVLAALLLPPAARADDVTDQIDQAVTAYKKKDLNAAITALEAAASLIRQMKTDAWKGALPAPLSGWTADKPQGEAISPVLLGGAITVSRAYHKGGETVTVSIIADSPVVQSLAAFMASGVGALLGSTAQVAVIDGRRVLKDDNSYQTLASNRVLVKVEGGNGDDAALRQYLKAVNYDEIDRLAK